MTLGDGPTSILPAAEAARHARRPDQVITARPNGYQFSNDAGAVIAALTRARTLEVELNRLRRG